MYFYYKRHISPTDIKTTIFSTKFALLCSLAVSWNSCETPVTNTNSNLTLVTCTKCKLHPQCD